MNEINNLIKLEEKRQQETLALIPSENYASRDVMEAVGSVLANKYAEGYPAKRYYQGNKIIDDVENLAIERAKKLFGVPHVNVQPYSGSPANAAAIMAVVEPGETIMGLKLSGGGHLTHGHKVSFTGKFFKSVQYDVDPRGVIDYSQLNELAATERPKLVIAGTTAYPRIIDWNKFSIAAQKAGDAYLLADISHIAGLVVGGQHPSPVPFADIIMTTTHKTLRGPRGAILMVTDKGMKKDPDLAKKIDKAVFPGMQGGPHENVIAGMATAFEEASRPEFREYTRQIVANAKVLADELINLGFVLTTGGTDNHLMVIDLTHRNISGKDAAIALEEAGIIVNANAIPHDPNPPMNPSGIRLGTPALTTRGMKEAEMKIIAGWISEVIYHKSTPITDRIREDVKNLCLKFPVTASKP